MKDYSTMFDVNDFNYQAINVLHDFIEKRKFFREKNIDRRCDMLQELFISMKRVHSCTGHLHILPYNQGNLKVTDSHYRCQRGKNGLDCSYIFIDKPSLSTFLHEFRHMIQDTKTRVGGKSEDDAHGWSHSLWKLASPKTYERAVNKNILLFAEAKKGKKQ